MNIHTDTTTTYWIKYDDQPTWHISGSRSDITYCGEEATGEEESQVSIPHSAPTCRICEQIASERQR